MQALKTEELNCILNNDFGQGFCPLCGSRLHEINRTNQGRSIYLWFACEESNCSWQWLQKKGALHGDKTFDGVTTNRGGAR